MANIYVFLNAHILKVLLFIVQDTTEAVYALEYAVIKNLLNSHCSTRCEDMRCLKSYVIDFCERFSREGLLPFNLFDLDSVERIYALQQTIINSYSTLPELDGLQDDDRVSPKSSCRDKSIINALVNKLISS